MTVSANGQPIQCLAGYRRPAGADIDECLGPEGAVRPVWEPLIARIERLDPHHLAALFARAQTHLSRIGVVHRVYADGDAVRPWPLAPMPILISASEWAELAAGIAERAGMLNDLLCDAYGDASLVTSGDVPAALYAASPEFARPLVQGAHGDAQPLRFYAADLARQADGRWCVLSDRTQAPSGLGYALENRLAMAHAFPDVLAELSVCRLDGFFQDVRHHLVGLKRNADARIGLFSPGPMNETFFEHAYLARIFDFDLVEGQDLVVRAGDVFMRTIDGLKPCEVLWRRIDSDFTDPLDLNARSRIGVPGLVQAARAGRVRLVNAIGSGLAESRAWMSILPEWAERRLGRPLRLPTQPTLWGFDAQARTVMASRFDDMVIGSAFGASLPGIGTGFVKGSALSRDDRDALLAHLERRGVDIVAQELMPLATTPVFDGTGLVPRPFVLRVFAAWTGSRWHVMPGGFARVAADNDDQTVSLQRGGRSADVWVIADEAAEAMQRDGSAIRVPDLASHSATSRPLLSRAADNAFWFGRYSERTQLMLRLARAALAHNAHADPEIYEAIAAMLVSLGGLHPFSPGMPPDRGSLASTVLHGAGLHQSIGALAQATRNAAFSLRDWMPPDVWQSVCDCVALVQAPLSIINPDREADDVLAQALKHFVSLKQGLQASVHQSAAQCFLDLGQRIERSIALARLVERFASDDPRFCKILLELAGEAGAHSMRGNGSPTRSAVIEHTMRDTDNPESLALHMQMIANDLSMLPRRTVDTQMNAALMRVDALRTDVAAADIMAFDPSLPQRVVDGLMRLSEDISRLYLRAERAGAMP